MFHVLKQEGAYFCHSDGKFDRKMDNGGDKNSPTEYAGLRNLRLIALL